MSERDRMTRSDDKPVPHGLTEAEFTDQQTKEAAQQTVSRDEAAKRVAASQRQSAADVEKRAQMQQGDVEVNRSDVSKLFPAAIDITTEIKNKLHDITFLARNLESSEMLAGFTAALRSAQSYLEGVINLQSEKVE